MELRARLHHARLAELFFEFDDAVRQVLLPMGVTFCIGLGDTREQAQASHEAAARRFDAGTDAGRPGKGVLVEQPLEDQRPAGDA